MNGSFAGEKTTKPYKGLGDDALRTFRMLK